MTEKINNNPKKVILTGATGLIGKETIEPLIKDGFEVYALTSKNPPFSTQVHWIQCNLFDETSIKNVFLTVKPQYLLHFAWITTGDFVKSNINFDFVIASLNLLKYFNENDGKRAVYVGTGTEYAFSDEPMSENTPLEPKTVYAKCKNNLRELAELYCEQNDISFAWGRVFNAIGYDDNKKRLTAYIIDNLLQDKESTVNSGHLIRDYMYTKDLAKMFVKLLESDITGAINVCSGKGMSLREYILKLAEKMNKTELLTIKNIHPDNQSLVYVGDNSKFLSLIDYQPEFSIDTAIDDILNKIQTNCTV